MHIIKYKYISHFFIYKLNNVFVYMLFLLIFNNKKIKHFLLFLAWFIEGIIHTFCSEVNIISTQTSDTYWLCKALTPLRASTSNTGWNSLLWNHHVNQDWPFTSCQSKELIKQDQAIKNQFWNPESIALAPPFCAANKECSRIEINVASQILMFMQVDLITLVYICLINIVSTRGKTWIYGKIHQSSLKYFK